MRQLKKLFEPIKIGNFEIRNRIVMAPFGGAGGFAKDGFVNEEVKAFYRERAKGGAGLIMMGLLSPIEADMWGLQGSLAIHKDEFIPGLRELTAAIHAEGAKVGVQLSFYGWWAKEGKLEEVSPSGVIFSRRRDARPSRPLTLEEIEGIIQDFAEATRRARDAGFDIVEYHASTGAIIGQFLSPLTNRRTDGYGGDLEARMRFFLEIIDAGRKKVGPDYALTARVSGSDFMEGGHTLEDVKVMAPILERAGLQALDVTTGWHEAPVPFVQMEVPRGAWVYLGEAVKKVVNIPVIGGTRINDPILAEEVIAQDRLDMVYMGRPLLADPELPNKARKGLFEDIRPCIACVHCFSQPSEFVIECSVNPRAGKELEYTAEPTKVPRRVFVIGRGPGGMEAALVASQRGHKVTLYDRGDTLGGMLLVASLPPHKDEIPYYIRYLVRQLGKSGAEVRLNTEVTAQNIVDARPDVVIVATGGVPIIPDIPGISGHNVVTAEGVLTGRKAVGDKIIMVGGGLIGCETADFLAERGKDITILEMLHRIGNDIGPANRWPVIQRLRAAQVRMETRARVVEITEKGALVRRDGATELFEGDSVVLAVGMKSEDRLAKELKGKLPELHVIGDAAEPRRIINAVREGFRIACEV